MSTANGSLEQSIRKAEIQKRLVLKVNDLFESFDQLTKYHISPNITTRERMNVTNTKIWPRGV